MKTVVVVKWCRSALILYTNLVSKLPRLFTPDPPSCCEVKAEWVTAIPNPFLISLRRLGTPAVHTLAPAKLQASPPMNGDFEKFTMLDRASGCRTC